MTELYDSFLRITYDPDGAGLVLVDFGDALWGEMALDGEQVVQEQAVVRAAGIKAFPRGNERHRLIFELCRIEEDLPDAFAARVTASTALPRGMADVLVALEDGRSWRLKDAAVKSWPGTQVERLTRERVELVGGRLVGDDGVYTPNATWGEISMLWEDMG